MMTRGTVMRSAAMVGIVTVATLGMGCRDPVAPMVPSCNDEYSPASCLDGEETCETDDDGCRVCTCERDAPPALEER